ncbi:MAG: hypothetical protein M1136_08040 [Chloroflexi bacterium]|nr:hypothetical protein [Chloroflexota bacterium]MCL5075583.1 hypothetical protein [Chloroflexota bacterium]
MLGRRNRMVEGEATIKDEHGAIVAQAKARFMLAPRRDDDDEFNLILCYNYGSK